MKLVHKETGEVVEALQWRGRDVAEACMFMEVDCHACIPGGKLYAQTPKGNFTACVGEWVVKGKEKGEFVARTGLYMNEHYRPA